MEDARPSVSVITVTNRYGGIDLNWSSLRRQTFKNFEWILNDTLQEERKEAVRSYTRNDVRIRHLAQGRKSPEAKTWLNHAENEAIAQAQGELIVLLQDYIHIAPDALEKFWYQYQDNPKRMVTGVGHQYGKPGKEDIVDPKGLITVFSTPFEGIPEQIVWQDPRMRTDQGSFYACMPNDIEFNYCAIPTKAFYDIGGCDEEYDMVGHAWDNCSVAERAFMLGYEPYIDQSNESKSVRHDDFFDTKVKVDDWREIATFHQNRMQEIAEGKRPLRYSYLDKIRGSAITKA